MNNEIQNPGSALGEAIGAEMEKALNNFLGKLVETVGFHFISNGIKSKTGKYKKLLMFDSFGTAYNIDSVIANQAMQPIILFESKYIRYKKHNRDKGSWLCTAHPAVRRRYASIRSSVAVLAGNWSSSSLAMMRSYDINIFLIPFERICELLLFHGIDFNWTEKDRQTAIDSWNKYKVLSSPEKEQIGIEMVQIVEDELENIILTTLDDSIEREVDRVLIELHSNIGEAKIYEFSSVSEAITFLNTDELKEVFITTDSVSLFDPAPTFDDESSSGSYSAQLDLFDLPSANDDDLSAL